MLGRRGKFLHESLALCHIQRRAKFQQSSGKGTFSNWGLNERGGVENSMDTDHISETVRDRARLLLINDH